MIIGYARVSTQEQSLEVQKEAIRKYADEIGEPYAMYEEKQSGGKADRTELKAALKAVQPGNKFVVYKIDRLARSTKQLYEITDKIADEGAEFVSIRDNIDTTTSSGRAMFGMLAVFAEFERNIISERTKAGLESAKRQGRTGGRPSLDKNTKRQIVKLFNEGERATDIAKVYNVGRSTVYKILKESNLQEKAGE